MYIGMENTSSVIIDKVEVSNVFALEPEHQAPVTGNPDRPLAATITLEPMQPCSRQAPNLVRSRRGFERSQQDPEPCRVTRTDAARVTGVKEPIQPLVAYGEDHASTVTCHVSLSNMPHT